jgi:hypothetical protein
MFLKFPCRQVFNHKLLAISVEQKLIAHPSQNVTLVPCRLAANGAIVRVVMTTRIFLYQPISNKIWGIIFKEIFLMGFVGNLMRPQYVHLVR